MTTRNGKRNGSRVKIQTLVTVSLVCRVHHKVWHCYIHIVPIFQFLEITLCPAEKNQIKHMIWWRRGQVVVKWQKHIMPSVLTTVTQVPEFGVHMRKLLLVRMRGTKSVDRHTLTITVHQI